MKISDAYHHRSVPDEEGNWGNDTVDGMVKRFPWLGPLVAELQNENDWSRPHRKGAKGWSAMFFEDHIKDQETKISLTMMPSRKYLGVKQMMLDENAPPTLRDIEHWIIIHIKRV